MKLPEAIFEIIEDNSCPLYKLGDEFELSGRSLTIKQEGDDKVIVTSMVKLPYNKPICNIIIGDITSLLVKYERVDRLPVYVGKCSGCSGSVKIEYRKQNSEHVSKLLSNFSIFRTIDNESIKDFISYLKTKKFNKDDIIIKKGDPGQEFYIIVSGKVEIITDDGLSIAFLGKEEVFGEMSLLSGESAAATVKAVKPTTVLYLNGKDFIKVLSMFPSLQLFFTRLLTKRLADTNISKTETYASGMSGRLSEMTPSELFQTFHINRKTGILKLDLSDEIAEICFRKGMIIRAKYGEDKGKEAFFQVLKAKDGRFRFIPGLSEDDMNAPEIGNFLWLLMEGLKNIDHYDHP